MVAGFPGLNSCIDLGDLFSLALADYDSSLPNHRICKGDGHNVKTVALK
jgi:hypothetical protein